MLRKVKQVGMAAALVAATLFVPTHAAQAADGCGSGWYKEGDGYMTKDNFWSGAGNHNAWTYHSGRVRFCTKNNTFNDDENRRALIGYPNDSYPMESWVNRNGNFVKLCARQVIRAYLTGVKTSESWTLGGTVSKSSPSVKFSYSATYDRLTVTINGARVCGSGSHDLIPRTSGIVITGTNGSARVEWVELTTKLVGEYWSGGRKYGVNHSVVEKDYS